MLSEHGEPLLWLIAIGFVMLEAIWVFSYLYFVEYERVCDDVRDSEPMDEKPRVCASGYEEGIRAAYKCAEGPPGSKWNLAGDLPPTTIRRRANAKELRRAYDRAREELKALEREARPKRKIINK